MAQISTSDLRGGMKVEFQNEPYSVVSNEFVKPGKGQAFNRIKIKGLRTGKVVEKNFKSGEKLDLADVEETRMRFLYREAEDFIFMDESSYEQYTVPLSVVDTNAQWCMEDLEYEITFYKGEIIDITPPMFLEMEVTETEPGLRGDTSGKVLKPSVTETGAKIKIPLFVNQGDKIKIDTRTGEYVSRV